MSRRIKPARILHHHATRRCSSSQSTQIPFSSRKSPIISSSSITTGPFIHTQKHNFSGDNFGREEFPGGRFAIPSATGAGKRPSVRVGGGGISLGPEFEPELEGLPWCVTVSYIDHHEIPIYPYFYIKGTCRYSSRTSTPWIYEY